jgi:hypothetical protein
LCFFILRQVEDRTRKIKISKDEEALISIFKLHFNYEYLPNFYICYAMVVLCSFYNNNKKCTPDYDVILGASKSCEEEEIQETNPQISKLFLAIE